MKPLLAGAVCAALLAACNQTETAPEPVDKAQDAASAAVGQASAAVDATTVTGYATGTGTGDLYEIQSAQIAIEKSKDDRLQRLAKAILTEHTASNTALRAALSRVAPDTPAPTTLDERRQGLIDNLRSAAPANFDTTWLDQQIAAHREALALQRAFASQDSPLAAHAQAEIPKIEAHLREAEAIKAAQPAH